MRAYFKKFMKKFYQIFEFSASFLLMGRAKEQIWWDVWKRIIRSTWKLLLETAARTKRWTPVFWGRRWNCPVLRLRSGLPLGSLTSVCGARSSVFFTVLVRTKSSWRLVNSSASKRGFKPFWRHLIFQTSLKVCPERPSFKFWKTSRFVPASTGERQGRVRRPHIRWFTSTWSTLTPSLTCSTSAQWRSLWGEHHKFIIF